ncbi:hypothetical protein LWF01_16280 [Saxibacter everestensis]|uniref:Uncharacterized protein n=1 Tax=Saxibacter everestensis TaxID=2909229 RepID=A0ABY8QRK8_9MICO|nr:hypothetical protein LWF01_16280 [Brevibacteriaceae bacterium ZFBP1038]
MREHDRRAELTASDGGTARQPIHRGHRMRYRDTGIDSVTSAAAAPAVVPAHLGMAPAPGWAQAGHLPAPVDQGWARAGSGLGPAPVSQGWVRAGSDRVPAVLEQDPDLGPDRDQGMARAAVLRVEKTSAVPPPTQIVLLAPVGATASTAGSHARRSGCAGQGKRQVSAQPATLVIAPCGTSRMAQTTAEPVSS